MIRGYDSGKVLRRDVIFTAIIWGEDRHKFSPRPERSLWGTAQYSTRQAYKDKDICVMVREPHHTECFYHAVVDVFEGGVVDYDAPGISDR